MYFRFGGVFNGFSMVKWALELVMLDFRCSEGIWLRIQLFLDFWSVVLDLV